uniref:Putative carboxyl methyltransferase n=1 Tax=Amycolatopsis sp. SANK 60206 TaxID=1642649 RepID=A0A0E3Z7K3_9PSEU|nr:putative carboxyl methyltransferase [Amycolatopsis sp. SANK 60206]
MDGSATPGLSFGEIAERYDRCRPGVPSAALDWLLPDGCETVIDLAAGTGALTRSLVDRVPQVVAVEPDPRMLDILARNCPQARALPGSAEQMPLPDRSSDALLTSMAWHWMDPRRALPEIARILRGGGTFGVIWNHRDVNVGWVAALDNFSRTLRARASGRDAADATSRRHVPDPAPGLLFGPMNEVRLSWTARLSAEELVGVLGTDSSAIALSAEARRLVDDGVTGYVRDVLGLSGDRTIELPMECRCLSMTRNPGAVP